MRIVVILLILIGFPLMGWLGYVFCELVEKNKKVGFFDVLFTSEEPENFEEKVEKTTDDFLQALRDALKRQGKKPCDTCYSMMEPGDPRIPVGHSNYKAK